MAERYLPDAPGWWSYLPPLRTSWADGIVLHVVQRRDRLYVGSVPVRQHTGTWGRRVVPGPWVAGEDWAAKYQD